MVHTSNVLITATLALSAAAPILAAPVEHNLNQRLFSRAGGGDIELQPVPSVGEQTTDGPQLLPPGTAPSSSSSSSGLVASQLISKLPAPINTVKGLGIATGVTALAGIALTAHALYGGKSRRDLDADTLHLLLGRNVDADALRLLLDRDLEDLFARASGIDELD